MASQANTDQQINVVHSVRVWLNQTVTWLYTLVKNQPPLVENHVVCNQLNNYDQFLFERLIFLGQDFPPLQFLSSKSWKVRKWRHSHRVDSLIRGCGAQVLHSHFGNHGWENISTARRAGLKHVVTFYGFDASRLPQADPIWRERYLEMFETAHLFLCEGPYLGENLIKLGCPREKVQVQHLGVDLQKIRFRTRFWQPDEPLKVLLAGSFVEKKGLPYAFQALGRIKNKATLEITVIGDDNGQERSKQEKAAILDSIADSGLVSQTRLLGYQPYSVLLKEAEKNHLFLSPSVTAKDGDAEGGAPVSIIEMAASGMPVVSSFHCDIPEVLEDGRTGLLAKERDVDELESKLTWLIDNPGKWPEMGTAARKHIELEFDSIIQSERLGAQYRSLVNS